MSDSARAIASRPSNIAFAKRLAAWAVDHYHMPVDEAEASALIGLCWAARKFDPATGMSFKKYARARIRGAIADEARSWRAGHRRPIACRVRSIFERIDKRGDDDELTIADLIADQGDSPGESLESRDYLESFLRDLSEKQRTAIRELYFGFAGATLDEVAGRMGVSKSRVCQLRQMAVGEIRAGVEMREGKAGVTGKQEKQPA